jgi:hypothetical protein
MMLNNTKINIIYNSMLYNILNLFYRQPDEQPG